VTFPAFGTKAQAVASLFVNVTNATTTTMTADRTVAYPGEAPVHLSVFVSSVAGWSDTVTFLDELNGSVSELATNPVQTMWNAGGASFALTLTDLALGVHTITARYNGSFAGAVSTSAPIAITVNPDTAVHATFTRSLSTFYPTKDSYRDTVALGGVLGETATVSVRVYSSTGALKRAWSLGSKPYGKYSVAWNGRTASGTQVPAGTYTVKALFKDVPGHLLTLTTKVVVNWRAVKWLTGTAIIRYGDQFSYYGTPGAGLYKSSDYSRGRILDSGEMIRDCIPPACNEIYGITSFQLKTSVLAYKSINLGLVGHGFTNREHDGTFYTVNPTTGKWQGRLDLPDYSNLTLSYGISAAAVSTTGRLRVVFDMVQSWGDAWDIHYVKLRYQYAVWK
jgi:hypothetical protein